MQILMWLVLLTVPTNSLGITGQLCKQRSVEASILSGEEFSHGFARDLEMRLRPLKSNDGWVVSIGPKGSDADWTYPVTFPIRTGEQQVIGAGFGSTVEEKLAHPIMVKFVLTRSDFVAYSEMAYAALRSPRPDAAGEFITKVAKLKKGRLTIVGLDYEKGDTAGTIKRMNFRATLSVPTSFHVSDAGWIPVPCPAF